MRAVIKKERAPGLTFQMMEEPQIVNPQDVKIKILKASICGTDLHIYKWDQWSQERIKPPQIGGHEFVGKVMQIGPAVKGVKPGDYVACETHIPCGVCYLCKTGNMHVCSDMKILGVHRDGVFADYVVVPEVVLWKVDKSIPLEYASVMEPLGNAIHTLSYVDLRAKNVLITGAGPIGAMAIAVAKISGAASIMVSEVSEYRRNMAQSLGADLLINPAQESLQDKVKSFTNGHGADVLIEMSGNVEALNSGMNAVRNCGQISILGVFKDARIPFEMNTAVFKNLSIFTVTGRKMFETWHQAEQWLKYRKIDISKVVTHSFDLEDFEKGFELMASGKSGKIVLNINKD